jgi:hypothetical protein
MIRPLPARISPCARARINRRIQLGWALLAAGLVVGISGILLRMMVGDLPFNARIITGIGILLIGLGISNIVRYRAALQDKQAARRMISEGRDERIQAIRARAGNRAYWISAALAYTGLMWLSFSENGSLPPLSTDTLWYILSVIVVLPFVVYAGSLIYDQANN